MAITKLNPYLNFNGTAEKAIELYKRALGAKPENVMRFGDAQGMPVPPDQKDRIMHAVLHVGAGVIMLSDTRPNEPVAPGGNAHVVLDFDSESEMAKSFDALANGGKVTMPLQDTFWGAKFGTLTDTFGINWMFNCEKKKS
jgi:PhnB protein